jgi:hypothetical protein
MLSQRTAQGPPVLSLRHGLDCRDSRVTRHRDELQQFALRVRRESFDLPYQRTILSGFFEDVQTGQDRLAIAKNLQLAVARRCCRAKEEGYRDLANVYKDEEFSRMRENPELQEVVAPPIAK